MKCQYIFKGSRSAVCSIDSVWRALMRPKAAHSSCSRTRTQFLPLAVQNLIQAQVSANPNYFIEQILRQGSSFSPHLLSPYTQQKMEAPHADKIDPRGAESECVSKDKGNAKISKSEAAAQKHVNKKSRGKRTRSEVLEGSEEAQPARRKSPNFFVGVRITDPQIHSTAKRVQAGILEASEVDISSTCIDPVKFHITLMVMHLGDEHAVNKAEETLEQLGPVLARTLEGREVTLEFQGLAVFGGGRVVFTPPRPSLGLDDLHRIADKVVAQMKENGINSTDRENKVLHPHLTLFKFKDDKHLFRQGIRKIKESLYAPFKEEYFGSQKITSIQLCQMGDEKHDDGYYLVKREVAFHSQDTAV